MEFQTDLTPRKRGILIDWLIEVHYKFKLEAETLYITVSLIDRYLSCTDTPQDQLQLVGVTALLIASKYEEIYPPEIADLVYITDNTYTTAEIIQMEESMLSALEFRITVATPFFFINRHIRAIAQTEADALTAHMASYLSELALVEYSMVKYTSSVVATSVVYMARVLLGHDEPWVRATSILLHFRRFHCFH